MQLTASASRYCQLNVIRKSYTKPCRKKRKEKKHVYAYMYMHEKRLLNITIVVVVEIVSLHGFVRFLKIASTAAALDNDIIFISLNYCSLS